MMERSIRFGVVAALVASCTGPATLVHDGGPAMRDAADDEAPEPIDAATETAPSAPVLALSIDPSLDQSDDDIKIASIDEAKLLDPTGAVVVVGTPSGGAMTFALEGLHGDYFIDINGDTDDLVPTRIDDAKTSLAQTVGQKLRASYIGPAGHPTYRIQTYSAGQSESQVVRYSDGTAIVPAEHPYLLYTFATSQVEIRRLGDAVELTSLPLPRCVGHPDVPADAWMINTTNQTHHGDAFNDDAGQSDCQSCHWAGTTKKYTYGVITSIDGWCFKCHYGSGGSSAGFVAPTL